MSADEGHDRSFDEGSVEWLLFMPSRRFTPRFQVSNVSLLGERSGRILVFALRISRSRGLRFLIVAAKRVVPCRTVVGVE